VSDDVIPIDWPLSLRPRSVSPPMLQALSRSGGRSLGGSERVVQHDAGYWRFSFSVILSEVAQEMAWRAVEALADGRAVPLRVPVCESGRSPAALPDWKFPDPTVLHSDDTEFDDGTSYLTRMYACSVAATAAERATALTVAVTNLPKVLPWPGMFFTLNDRLYKVRTVTALVGNAVALTIRPPLRQAALAGDDINFDQPTGLFRLGSDSTGARNLDLLRFGTLSLDLVEWV
jgi:hypothetical protein